jgi:hypothetical protein
MKSLSEYQALLQSVMAYKPTIEWTKKLLSTLGIEWREEAKWSLPLRLREIADNGPNSDKFYDLVDADEAILLVLGELTWRETESFQRILSAANAELSRTSQDLAQRPLIYRQGDSPR